MPDLLALKPLDQLMDEAGEEGEHTLRALSVPGR